MTTFDREYELFRNGLSTKIRVKDHPYDLVEFTMFKKLTDEDGKVVVDSAYTTFFSSREFTEFFTPLLNDLKVKIENDNSTSQ